MYNLFPQFVIVVSHTQSKLIQPDIALVLFGPVALDTVSSEKFICDHRFGMRLLCNRMILSGIRGLGCHRCLPQGQSDCANKDQQRNERLHPATSA
jgi:hypothetical protein